jgi:hypothetical protein
MAGTIGTVACDFLHGVLPGLKARVQTWSVPGVNGYGAQLLGLGDSDFQLIAVRYGNLSTVGQWEAAIEALQGAVVAISDEFGWHHPRCLIERVQDPLVVAAWPKGVRCQVQIYGKQCP